MSKDRHAAEWVSRAVRRALRGGAALSCSHRAGVSAGSRDVRWHDPGWHDRDRHDPGWHEPDWQNVIAIASAHFVLALIAPLLRADAPGDVGAFGEAFRQANAARNARLRQELFRIVSAMGGVQVPMVALKGAAFLAQAEHRTDRAPVTDPESDPEASRTPGDAFARDCAPWRFMSDLDLLVPQDRLGAAIEQLEALGFCADARDYNPRLEAHYPPIWSSCGTFGVELHTRVLSRDPCGLPARTIWRDAREVAGAEGLFVPDRAHRLMHVVGHAMVHNHGYAGRRLVLKDVADWITLSQTSPAAATAASAALSDHGRGRETAAFLAACRRITDPSRRPSRVTDPCQRWAHQAVARIGWPGWRHQLAAPVDGLRVEFSRWSGESGHGLHRWRQVTQPGRLLAALATRRAKTCHRTWRTGMS